MTDAYFAGAFNAVNLEHAKSIVLTPDPARPGKFDEETKFLVDFMRGQNLAGDNTVVLDFGCGMGRVAKALVEQCQCYVVGVDISPSMRVFAKQYVGNPARFAALPAYTEPNSVDVVLAAFTLQHTENPAKEVETLYTALKPGGAFVLLDDGKRFVPRGADEQGFVVWQDDGASVQELMQARFALQNFYPYLARTEQVLSVWRKA